MTASQMNMVKRLINKGVPREEAGKLTKEEAEYYDDVWAEAVEVEKKYGFWPVLEMTEIEWEDPVLDIYNSPPEEMRGKK